MRRAARMTRFDKVCAVLSIGGGGILMVVGVIGLFTGGSIRLSLPPVLGGLPFLLGWSMCVLIVRYWRLSKESDSRND
jgi:hypothetical protein